MLNLEAWEHLLVRKRHASFRGRVSWRKDIISEETPRNMLLRKEGKTSQGTKPTTNKDSERVSMHKKPGEIYEIKGGLDCTRMLPITKRISSK